MNEYDIVAKLTSSTYSRSDQRRMLNDFASEMGWQPSYSLELQVTGGFANAHLVVEHGLENTAVITFLRQPRTYSDLGHHEKMLLLSLSYNNLVDWHIQVEPNKITVVFNRTMPPSVVDMYPISRDQMNDLRGECFQRSVAKRPSPNLPALDNALIQTISYWKRNLSAEMGPSLSNECLSALFNAIIFVRAAEDDYQRQHATNYMERGETQQTAREIWASGTPTLGETLVESLKRFADESVPTFLVNTSRLSAFDDLDRQTVTALLANFYRNKYAPYDYDFSLMSKHALSRIYEHYVSILHLEESAQKSLPLFPRLPEEELNRAYGSIYTPQFVARFFARYLREQLPPSAFRHLKTVDPACGSGIFLRTLLELQCDPEQDTITTEMIDTSFDNAFGMDIDENACQATRLSLAMLYLALTHRLPKSLHVASAESIGYFQQHPELAGNFGAVIANPPFISTSAQTPALREVITQFMKGYASGRVDAYLAFLRIATEMLTPGGFGLFVLPHSFLLGRNAAGVRRLIAQTAWVRCLADLSAIRVFRDTGSYVILLIFQKKASGHELPPAATVLKCQDLVGQALQDLLEDRRLESSYYSIYDVNQSTFEREEWLVLPPTEARLEAKLAGYPRLGKFLHVREGFISGRDDVFIVPAERVPVGEAAIYAPYLPDRMMRTYSVPDETSQYLFYPYVGDEKLSEDDLRRRYPQTWQYLSAHKEALQARSSVASGDRAWWEPLRPRLPRNMMRAKLVSPHLVLVPRFSLDLDGKYAVSRAPLLYPKTDKAEADLLRFFVAVLNSSTCYWHIATHSHVYQRGYVMLEPKTLAKTPVPDPAAVPATTMLRLLVLVDRRLQLAGAEAIEVGNQIDGLIADLYGLSQEERRALGMEVRDAND